MSSTAARLSAAKIHELQLWAERVITAQSLDEVFEAAPARPRRSRKTPR